MQTKTHVTKVKDIIKKYRVDPDWQRNCNVWSLKTAKIYIDDVINQKPMPPILAFKNKTTRENIVIDGKQRICTLRDILAGDELTRGEKKAVENYEFTVNHYSEKYFHTDKKLDPDKVVEFFTKTNTSGTPPNAQEIRRAVHHTHPYIKYVKQESVSKRFLAFLNKFEVSKTDYQKAHNRFLDEEFILKTLAYYFTENFIQSPYTNKIIDKIVAKKSKKNLEEAFESILDTFDALYLKDTTPKRVRFIGKYKGVMPIILGLLAQFDIKGIKENREEIKEFLKELWFLNHPAIATKNKLAHNSGSGFYRAIVNLIVDKMDNL